MSLRPTLRHRDAEAYLRPGGPWDVPSLDRVMSAVPVSNDPVVVDGDRRIERSELDADVAVVAGALRDRGVEPGDVVAWQRVNGYEPVVLCRACWRLGAIAAPLHHGAGAAEIERMIAVIDPKVVVAAGPLPADGTAVYESPAEPADLAVVQFTSGSTGEPKAVLQTHRSLAYKARCMARVHGLGPTDAVLMPSPIAHISGLLNGVLLPGATGMRAVFMDKWDPARALELIERERISFMVGPPTLFTGLMELPDFTPQRVASMRVISSGAMGVRPSFVREAAQAFGARVKRAYGSTEAPTMTTSAADDPTDRDAVTDGRVVGAAEITVVDPHRGVPVPAGTRGEVWVRGPELFSGYAVASQTEAVMADGWFRTGDLGVLDADGWLEIVGRLKDLIIRGGENIAAAEVEQALEAHPDIRQAVVVGYPDDRLGERVAAFVVSDAEIDPAWCLAWFERQGIAKFKTPERVVRLDAVPLLGIGKPDRAALRARAASGQ